MQTQVPFVLGWDLGTQHNGWAAGPADRLPVTGHFPLTKITDFNQMGDMGSEFSARVMAIHHQFPDATHWVSERPLLVPTDARFTLERLYGLSCILQTIGRKLGKTCALIEPGAAKTEWAGRNAEKDQMVAMAEALGIALPTGLGRKDAADACGVRKVGIRLFAKQYLHLLDGAVYRRRGALL